MPSLTQYDQLDTLKAVHWSQPEPFPVGSAIIRLEPFPVGSEMLRLKPFPVGSEKIPPEAFPLGCELKSADNETT